MSIYAVAHCRPASILGYDRPNGLPAAGEREGVSSATIWAGKQRMHRADKGMRARRKGKACDKGRAAGVVLASHMHREGVTLSMLLDFEAKATLYVTRGGATVAGEALSVGVRVGTSIAL